MNDRRRALPIVALLAGSPDGCTEAVLLAQGITREQLAELVRDGQATSSLRRIRVGRGKPIEVVKLRITEAGRKALKA